MASKYMMVVLCAAISLTACKKNDGDESSAADTSTVPGQDTVNMPMSVPTTDTVVTTTTTETDTIHTKVDNDTLKRKN